MIYTVFYAILKLLVELFSTDSSNGFTATEDSSGTRTLKYFRSNCLDNTWNPISTVECQLDSRGPCDEGQTFSAVPDDLSYEWMDITMKTCASSIPDGCRGVDNDPSEEEEPLSAVKFRHGVCLWSEENHPCRGYPSGYRWQSLQGKCLLSDGFLSTGCGKDQMFASVNQTHGQCQCRYHDDVMWPVDGECYKFHTQGPCGHKDWLTVNSRGQVTCRSTNCPADGNHVEWTRNRIISCYRLNEQGPCPNGKYVVRSGNEVECGDFDSEQVRRALLRGIIFECDSGMVRDRRGRCRRIFGGKK